ncbi:MAG: cytochrome b/b6 domain-containing protein [Bdellovibrionaceae bacterium]|nr:cytochrome b/b6 domain-containing protein [Pseudobdellovibrionaceae bacterium]
MRNQLIYDVPTRVFHWLFAGLFVVAFLIAKNVDDESVVYSYHMLAGLLLGFIVLLRLIWGFVGTRHSRFASFALHPRDLMAYFTGILSGDKRKWAGHNPASSWAALVMFGLALGLGLTGYLMSTGQEETFEDIHELLANGFLVVVLMHIAGVVLHAVRHRDGIAMAMLDGAKSGVAQAETISSARPAVALLFVGLVAAFAVQLSNRFDRQNQTLHLFGTTLQLGESEGDDETEHDNAGEDHDNDEDDEDDND